MLLDFAVKKNGTVQPHKNSTARQSCVVRGILQSAALCGSLPFRSWVQRGPFRYIYNAPIYREVQSRFASQFAVRSFALCALQFALRSSHFANV